MPRTDRASRVIAALPDQVCAALVSPEALTAWLPPRGMTGTFIELQEIDDPVAFSGTGTFTGVGKMHID